MITPTTTTTVSEVIRAISLGPTDPSEKGPVAVVITYSECIIIGTYTEDCPDIVSKDEVLESTPALRKFVDALLTTRTPFVTETNPEESCRLKWQMTTSAA